MRTAARPARPVSRGVPAALVAVVGVLLVLAGTLVGAGRAGAAAGPPLTEPPAALSAALACDGDLAAGPTPVLLVPGTTLTPDVNFSWNYEKVFSAAGRPWCAVTLPGHAMGDIQVAAQYVTAAIRTMHERAGRAVSVVGFSQGGMVPRWTLKYWPDTRTMVDDVVGIDPSNHGTYDAHVVCAVGGCAPAIWQQRTGSAFLTALNTGGETFAGLSYTQMYTALDEVVVPNFDPVASSALHTGSGRISNVLVQSICPGHVAEHLSMGTFDPVAYALVIDALTHAGPADPARVSRSVCLRASMPGVGAATVATRFPGVVATAGQQLLTYPHVAAEPPLAPYAAG
ncbi:Triacylglycerol esterase/lipase EstA, alpha/beta hydrolase fold [Jatrophihabitans endophyticus]|uniref:Triacylglycerol esterase/lipase EstA, alpha/beta hydrolase fold n=1 Tax=Jatrophihabitans endophyticus TaxID=1206085 RepID=A0A1M5C234_9ACTN|nr:lipase [Jatrophihabitans endophyticus]SHF48828.1 Triacylglycerol esterase/lipase EstA, alpha/beta hydrolase fold [Jatrophihabitans endophyticus]